MTHFSETPPTLAQIQAQWRHKVRQLDHANRLYSALNESAVEGMESECREFLDKLTRYRERLVREAQVLVRWEQELRSFQAELVDAGVSAE